MRSIATGAAVVGVGLAFFALNQRLSRQDTIIASMVEGEPRSKRAHESKVTEVRHHFVPVVAPTELSPTETEEISDAAGIRDDDDDDDDDDQHVARIERLATFNDTFETKQFTGQERRRESELSEKWNKFSDDLSGVEHGDFECRGDWCVIDVSFPSGDDVSRFTSAILELSSEVGQEGGIAVLPAMATQVEDDHDVGRVFLRWRN